jgi:hypothetical protein
MDRAAELLSAGEHWWTTTGASWSATFVAFMGDPWVRLLGLILIVYLTIRVIASIYSGDKQNSELGPIGIRPHAAQRLDRKTVVLPRHLMPMNMDGVVAKLKVYYAFTDARGTRRKQLVHTMNDTRIGVSPVKLTKIQSAIFGFEVPDVATADVCFPPVDVEAPPVDVPATPDRAREYANLHKLVENWREDDDALLLSLHTDQVDEVQTQREAFITSEANQVARARQGNLVQRWMNAGIAKRRPNVIGSYYLKFEFSHDPWFVLTRHPDKELKMTAWLTVLTSMFALVMDFWPSEPSQRALNGDPVQIERGNTRPPRPPG